MNATRVVRRTLLMLPLALAACGFEPVYAPGGSGAALDGKVQVSAPNSVETYLLVQNLEQRLGRQAGSGADYNLNVRLNTFRQGQAITATNETTRFTIVGKVRYTLTQIGNGAVVASGQVDNFTGYSATGSTVETLAGERDARERLMTILADQLTTQLIATVDLPS
ncbi:MAG: LPS assembly lipoprotein LptE [Ruegeria sp.]|uniref:LPS assembly lipoprotein LptE n=1 Tax=Ruegeria sp. TaxID=1879320 RepID=UPI00349E5023